MLNKKDIRAQIDKVTADYKHVLDCGPATVQINAPRALMQVEACSQLTTLYGLLGEKRPTFRCDDENKLNH